MRDHGPAQFVVRFPRGLGVARGDEWWKYRRGSRGHRSHQIRGTELPQRRGMGHFLERRFPSMRVGRGQVRAEVPSVAKGKAAVSGDERSRCASDSNN